MKDENNSPYEIWNNEKFYLRTSDTEIFSWNKVIPISVVLFFILVKVFFVFELKKAKYNCLRSLERKKKEIKKVTCKKKEIVNMTRKKKEKKNKLTFKKKNEKMKRRKKKEKKE